MLIVFLLWTFVFVVFFVVGFSVNKIISSINKIGEDYTHISLDEYFFMGFLTISAVSGILSIFMPVGDKFLLVLTIITVVLLIFNLKQIKAIIIGFLVKTKAIDSKILLLILFVFILLLVAVVQKITLGDTELYHTQFIKWVRSYAVVPGLGNIHGRFAFNSMFFVVSGPFTFELNDTLIYPLNGICLFVLLAKLIVLYHKESDWKSILYGLLTLLSIILLVRDLNSPSPDFILPTLTIYIFVFFISRYDKTEFSIQNMVLINLMVFSCIVFKLSSLFLILILLPLWKNNFLKGFLITSVLGLLVLIPFLVRNYYLSGYLIYPFPSIDIFNVDWKIPKEQVIVMKSWIDSWARIPKLPPTEVLSLKFSEWIVPWFKNLNDFVRIILLVNISLVFQLIYAVVKRDLRFVTITLVLLVNLFFWFVTAPDPRFIYGFLIMGFSLGLAYLIKIVSFPSFFKSVNFRFYTFSFLILFISLSYIKYPKAVLKNPSYLIVSAAFEKAELEKHETNFTYYVSISDSRCFNSAIPCTPFPIDNVVLRGKDISEGFKVIQK